MFDLMCCFIHMHLFASLMQQLGRKKQPSVAAQKLSSQKKRRLRSIQDKQQAPTVDLTSSVLPDNHVSDLNGLWKQVGDVNLLEADRYNNIHSFIPLCACTILSRYVL